MFWKVYFWVIIVLSIIGYAMEGLGGTWGAVDLIVSSGGLVGLFAYAYKKRLFVAKAWKAYLPLLILWDLAYSLGIKPETSGKEADMNTLAGFIFVIPIYFALYLYAFKFMAESGQSRDEPAVTSDETIVLSPAGPKTSTSLKPGKWAYGIALLLFVGGTFDFAVFIFQEHSSLAEGLSDPFALFGLFAWWVVASGIVAITFLRRKAAQPSVGVPAAEKGAAMMQNTPQRQESTAKGNDRRSTAGRQRPYQALRSLAKLYTVLAPLVLIIMVLVSLAAMTREVPLAQRVSASVGLFIMGGFYYLLMQSMAQAIYLLFDISGDVNRLTELADKGQ